MAEYKLHCFCQSGNSFKVALFLNCAGLDWEPVLVDFLGGQTRDPGWRESTNEMGEAPVLEHDGKKLSQSGAILTYLSERTGKFRPATEDGRLEALRWILFDNHKFTGPFMNIRFLHAFTKKEPEPALMGFLKNRFDRSLAIVDKHLEGSAFMLGDEPTIADFSLAGYLFYPTEETTYDFAQVAPNLHAWLGRLRELPGWKDPYEMMPGKRLPPAR